MKLSRARVLVVALVAPLALVAATTAPASAASAGAAVVTGSGSISPGLDVLPQPQMFSFSGNALTTGVINNAPAAAANLPITASGSDLAGSKAAGAGPISVSLSGFPTMNGYFVRVGAVVAVAVTAGTSAGEGVCAFQAHQLPPAKVTSYSVYCGALGVSAS